MAIENPRIKYHLSNEAITLATFYEDRYNKTFLEWNKYIKGDESVDSAVVPEEILESWNRCHRFGVDPLCKPEHKILTGSELQTLLADNKEFISISKPFLLNLYRFVKGS